MPLATGRRSLDRELARAANDGVVSAAAIGLTTMVRPGEPGRGTERPGHGERLLVVDDEADIADLLRAGLRFVGYDVRVARSGAEALAVTNEFRPQLVLMDVMLPDISGFELCRQVRQVRDPVGIVFLTARNRTEDAIAGLGAGGDDYISKPFSLDEVVARVRAVLRRLEPLWADRTSPRDLRDDGILRLADLELDEERHEVRRANALIDLSPTEFALLRFLLENGGRVLSRAQILSHVWSYEFAGEPSIVDSYVSYLRKKIDCFDPPLIHTVRGVGYALRVGR
jgi:two-component system OmpR family response regulator